jgi:four helix bundle protein
MARIVLDLVAMPETNDSSKYQSGQDIRDRTFEFACSAVGLCEQLYERGGVARMLVPQIVACSTATSTMMEEARAAESDRDFISKCCIALKECRESWARLRICERRRFGSPTDVKYLVRESGELIAIVGTIIRKKRSSMKQKRQNRARRPRT